MKKNPIFLKVHIERYISRIRRRVKLDDVENDTYACEIVKKAILEKKTPVDFGFLLDTSGAVLSMGDKNIGVITRNTKPLPYIKEKRYLVPIFSLYSKNIYNPQDPPLLVQLIKASKMDPIDYTTKYLAAPLMRHFDHMARKLNIVLQPHAQNTLVELDESFQIKRIVHRDIPTRAVTTNPNQQKWERCIEYSMMYDNYLCRDSLKLIGKVLTDYYFVDPKNSQVEYSLPEKLMERSKPIIFKHHATYR